MRTQRQTTHKKRQQFKQKSKIFSYLKVLFSLTLIIFLIYTLFLGNFFHISEISVNGSGDLQTKIHAKLVKLKGVNLVTLNTDIVKTELEEDFPYISNIKINKVFPKTIEINVITHKPAFNLQAQSLNIKHKFVLNSKGYIIHENKYLEALPYIKINTELINIEEDYKLNSKVLSERDINYIKDTLAYFHDRFNLKILHTKYFPIEKEVHLYTEKKIYIWLDIDIPFEKQLNKLKRALPKLNLEEQSYHYIDLRISTNSGDKVIFKKR